MLRVNPNQPAMTAVSSATRGRPKAIAVSTSAVANLGSLGAIVRREYNLRADAPDSRSLPVARSGTSTMSRAGLIFDSARDPGRVATRALAT